MAYVYKIIHKITGKIYIGLRLSHNMSPMEDLGSVYYTSSVDEAFKLEFKNNPDNFIKEIIEESSSREDMCRLEEDLLKAIPENARRNYYNRYFFNSRSNFYEIDKTGEKNPRFGKSLKQDLLKKYGESLGFEKYSEAMKKISEANKGTIQSENWKAKKNEALRKVWANLPEEERERRKKLIGEKNKGKPSPTKGKKLGPAWNKGKKLGPAWNKGIPHSEETKAKLREAWEKRKRKSINDDQA